MTQPTHTIAFSVFTERLAREAACHADDLADFERNFEGLALAENVPHTLAPGLVTTLQALDHAVQTSRTLAALAAIISQTCDEGATAVPMARLDALPLGNVRARMSGALTDLDIPATEFFA